MQAESSRFMLPGSADDLFESLSDPLVVVRYPDGALLSANAVARVMFAYEDQALVGLQFSDLLAEGQNWKDLGSAPNTQRLWCRRADGSGFEAECVSSPMSGEAENLLVIRIGAINSPESHHVRKLERLLILDAVLRTGSAFFVVLTMDGNISVINETMLERTGHSGKDFSGAFYPDLFIPEADRPLMKDLFANFQNYEPKAVYTNTILCADGTTLPVEWHTGIIRDESSRIRYFFAFGIDVSERLAFEEKLKRSEARFRGLVEEAPFAVAIAKGNSQIFGNRALADMLGYDDPSNLLGFSSNELVAPAERDKIAERIRRRAAGEDVEKIYPTILQRKDGAEVPVMLYVTRLELDEGPATVTVGFDISEWRKAVESLRRSESRFRSLIENAQVPIALVKNAMPIYVNPPFLRELGYKSFEEIGDINATSFVAPRFREAFISKVREAQKNQQAQSYESVIVRKNGTEIPAQIYPTTIQLDDGPATVVILINISAWKQAEAELIAAHRELELRVEERSIELKQAMNQLVQSEKLASLGSLVAGIAHELSTPVGNSLTLATALGTQGIELNDLIENNRLTKTKLESFLQTTGSSLDLIETNLRKVAQLVQNFRHLASDQTSDTRRSFSLGDIINEVVDAERPAYSHVNLALEVEVTPGLYMDSYPGPVRQVISELLENARTHAYPEGGGVVHLSAGMRNDSRVSIVCSDTGRGIAPELHKKLFDPFFTTRLAFGQSGLGLYLVFSLVTGKLGGAIRVHSLLGEGTRFELDLPRLAPILIG